MRGGEINLKKLFTIFAAFTLLLGSFAPLTFAETSLNISENGSESENNINVNSDTNTSVVQSNTATIVNTVYSEAKTGSNDANDNTGGDVTIDTGNAVSDVEVVNKANLNKAIVNDCNGCDQDVHVKISDNGYDSENEIELESNNNTEVFQDNNAYIDNYVDANAKTGYNDANRNTGGDVTVTTGRALTDVSVFNAANANVAVIGSEDNGNGHVSAKILDNGSESDNNIYLDLNRSAAIVQDNYAWINNYVDADSKTGSNDANDNTGGDVTIDTGNARTFAAIDNLANFNFAAVDCCDFGVYAKIAENGYDSENEIEAEFNKDLQAFQDNWFDVYNNIYADAKTGWNEADRNTGDPNGDPSVYTGHALSKTELSSSGDANIFSSDGHLPDFHFDFDLGELFAFLHHNWS